MEVSGPVDEDNTSQVPGTREGSVETLSVSPGETE